MVTTASLLSPFEAPRHTGASEPVLGSNRMACIGTNTSWHYPTCIAPENNARVPLFIGPGLSTDMVHSGRGA